MNLRHGAYETPALPLSYTADPVDSSNDAARDFTADVPVAPENIPIECCRTVWSWNARTLVLVSGPRKRIDGEGVLL